MTDNILFKQDRLSMAHGIEARVPFLDHRLVEFSARLPCRLKNDGRSDKVIVRRALAGRGFHSAAGRRKHAFYMPLDGRFKEWFWQLERTYLSPERLRNRGLFNERAVAQIAARADSSPLLSYKQLMCLVILEMWFELYVAGPGKRAGQPQEAAVVPRVQRPAQV